MKTCSKCGRLQDETEFWKRGGRLVARCKDCLRSIHREWWSNRNKHIEAIKSSIPELCADRRSRDDWIKLATHPDKHVAAVARQRVGRNSWYDRNRESILIKHRKGENDVIPNRASDLKRKYGITIEQFTELLWQQGGRCACCTVLLVGTQRRLAVDHCHRTGMVRGILCHPCNLGLGQFSDQPNLLAAAKSYLDRANHRAP
jgi:hypothetical protein